MHTANSHISYKINKDNFISIFNGSHCEWCEYGNCAVRKDQCTSGMKRHKGAKIKTNCEGDKGPK